MSKGFVFCAVLCSALALAVYAGLYEVLGISASVAVFVLLGLCVVFHALAMMMLRPTEESGAIHDKISGYEELSRDKTPPSMENGRPAARIPAGEKGDNLISS